MSGTISFPNYPSTNRVPGVYFDISPSQANSAQQNLPALLIGQSLAGSKAAAGMPVISQGATADAALCGQGSMLARMAAAFRAQNLYSTLWLLPLADDPAAVAATGSVTYSGTAAAAGTLPLYVAGQRLFVAVAPGGPGAPLPRRVAPLAATMPGLPVTAAAGTTAGQVVFTAKNLGAMGNDFDIRLAYLGAAGGEQVPAGITAAIAPMSGGATNPSLALPLAALSNLPFEVVIAPYTDAASLAALQNLMNDQSGRWSYTQQLYGHCYTAFRGTLGQATTLGLSLNDQHVSVLPISGTPTPMDELAATLGAAVSASVNADPAQPLADIPLGVLAPPVVNRFVFADRNALLYEGMSTYKVDQGGQVYTERLVTTFQTDPSGAPDTSYLDAETMHTLGYCARDMISYLQATFARRKLVDNAVKIPGGSNLVNPALIAQAAINRYRYQESLGLVQQSAVFAQQIQSVNAGNGQVSLQLPFILVNQFRVIAGLVDFTKP